MRKGKLLSTAVLLTALAVLGFISSSFLTDRAGQQVSAQKVIATARAPDNVSVTASIAAPGASVVNTSQTAASDALTNFGNTRTTMTSTLREFTGSEIGLSIALALTFGAVLFALWTSDVGSWRTTLASESGLLRLSPLDVFGKVGAAVRHSLKPVTGLAIMTLGVFVGTMTVTTGVVNAGTGGYLGQDGSAGFPMWTLIALGLGSLVLVGGGILTRRGGK